MLDSSQPEVAFAIRIVRQAAQLARQIQADMAEEGITKEDLSPVTVADFASQALAGQALQDEMPDHVLVGEESSDDLQTDDGAKALSLVTKYVGTLIEGADSDRVCAWIDHGTADPAERYWTIDPVDGTKGYLRGGHYAVALAFVEKGQVMLGALGCPNLAPSCDPDAPGEGGALLIAQRGKGTWVAPLSREGEWRQLTVSKQTEARQARMLRSVEAAHTNVGEIDHIADALGVEAEPVRMDSQAKYATLAAGGGEMLFRLLSPKRPDYKEKIWDQAAGSIVLEEAGGRITDLRGRDLDFTQGRTLARNTGVFASNGVLHDAGLEAIAKICKLPEA